MDNFDLYVYYYEKYILLNFIFTTILFPFILFLYLNKFSNKILPGFFKYFFLYCAISCYAMNLILFLWQPIPLYYLKGLIFGSFLFKSPNITLRCHI